MLGPLEKKTSINKSFKNDQLILYFSLVKKVYLNYSWLIKRMKKAHYGLVTSTVRMSLTLDSGKK